MGGGITGLSVAWHLAERGLAASIVERAGLGSGATAIQPGGVRRQWGNRVNCLLASESLAFYRDLAARLEVDVDPGFRECGYLFVTHSEGGVASLAANVALQNELGIPSRLITPDEAGDLVPGLDASTVFGAAYCAEDGYFDRPQAVVGAFISACSRAGVRVEAASATAVEPDGAAWRVELGDGRRLGAAAVVLAAAWDTPALLAPLGVELPIRREPRYLFYSDPIRERLLEPLVVSGERHLAAKQLADGSVLASDLSAGTDPRESEQDWRRRLRERLRELLPILDHVSYPVLVEGFYDLTPDGLAAIGPVGAYGGLWVAAGHSGRGFMMAPAVGRLLADAIAGDALDELLDAVAPDRFAGTELTPESQIV